MNIGGSSSLSQPAIASAQKEHAQQTSNPGISSQASSVSSVNRRFEDLNLIKGEQAIKMSGIVKSHVAVLKRVASKRNTILMFRPVNPLSTGLLANGAAAKGMHIKGKSSDWGPMAGFIPVDQALSKKWDDTDAIAHANKANKTTLDEHSDKVDKMPLELDAKRLDELSDTFGLIRLPASLTRKESVRYDENNPQHFPIDLSSNADDKNHTLNQQRSKFDFRLELRENNKYLVQYKAPHEDASLWRNVEVLCDVPKAARTNSNVKRQPITADYDAFAFLPRIEAMEIGSTEHVKELAKVRKLSSFIKAVERVVDTGSDVSSSSISSNSSLSSSIRSRGSDVSLGSYTSAASGTSTPRTRFSGSSFVKTVNAARDILLAQHDRRSVTEGIGRERKSDGDIRKTINNWVRAAGYEREQIVLHASEVDNVLYPEQDDNIFAVMPDGNVYITESWDQVQAFMHVADHQGYAVYGNRNWNSPSGSRIMYHNQRDIEGVKETPGKTIPWNPSEAYQREIDKST